MAMEWTREKTIALIQEYRKRHGLWDMTHEDYRKREVKHKLMEEVKTVLGGNIPLMEIEKKFHTLRTQYHREINRMKRKEPYNSKWFGFKYLQFLSSPKACRSSKGRIKAEINEEGTVTTKYIIPETITPNHHDTSVGSGNENEEFVTVQRRPTTITYEPVPSISNTSASSSRSHELEKLIEETTKDVEEIEDAKPKMIKEIAMPLDHHHQHHVADGGYGQAGSVGELHITNVESEHEEIHHIDDVADNIDPINIQSCSEDELNYQNTSCGKTTNGAIGVSTSNASSTTTIHTLPARIIKIQRRDTHLDPSEHYYEHQQHQGHTQQHHHHQQQQQQHHHHHQQQQHHQPPVTQQHHIQTVSPATSGTTTKRYYYDASGHHTGTILTSSATQQQQQMTNKAILTTSETSPQTSKINVRNSLKNSPPLSMVLTAGSSPLTTTMIAGTRGNNGALLRDEYSIYGEYVANEIRCIKNREILIALKHKINTALFEANMQELQM